MDSTEVNKNVSQSDSNVEQQESNIVQQPIEEMLGSVTTYNVESDVFGSSKNCQQLRTSARVFKKMKLDSALALTTSPVIDKEKKDTSDAKTEVKKPLRPQWTIEDKDMFFEALNEHGKDFDAIQQYINNKFKKKGLPDSQIKTKEQLRHFYYRTWHKVSKYLKYSEDIKKLAQELYALINYGELRKKVGPVSEKICMKLNELIYRGTVTIRSKGRSIRVKTPMCRALRKLNQLDEKHEDLKLPTRVSVEMRPKSMNTWLNVQFMSQNPRLRLSLPLQRRLSVLLNCVNERWKSQLVRSHEKVHSYTNSTPECTSCQGPLLRLAPKPTASVELPTINLSEYLTSHRICLNAYEERIGVKVPGEHLWQKTAVKKTTKRQRNESTGEKTIKQKEICDEIDEPPTTVSDVVDTAINTILSLQNEICESEVIKEELKPEPEVPINKEEEILKIKKGWTLENCGTLTIGEMYLMFGHDSKLELEYAWDPPDSKPESEPYESNELSTTLKKLLSLAKLHYRKERIHCPCGHICGGAKTNSANRNKSLVNKAAVKLPESTGLTTMRNVTVKSEPMFRKPQIIPSNGASSDSFKAQLDSLQRMRPKYTNRRGRPGRSKHVVVERMLPLLPKTVLNSQSLVMKVISQTDDLKARKLRPIAPRIEEVLELTNTDPSQVCETAELVETCDPDDPKNELSNEFFTKVQNHEDKDVPDEEEKVKGLEDERVSSPSSISNFLLGLPHPDTQDLISESKNLTSFAGLLSDELPDNSTPMSSPSRILKENDNQWLNAEVNDYSLTSLLGHLESPMKPATPANITCDDAPITQDIDSQFPSLLGENGVDFVDQFVDMAAQQNNTIINN